MPNRAEVQQIIEQLYLADGEASSEPETYVAYAVSRRRSSRSRRNNSRTPSRHPMQCQPVDQAEVHLSKVLNDERTNSLIVLANQDGHKAVRDLIAKDRRGYAGDG